MEKFKKLKSILLGGMAVIFTILPANVAMAENTVQVYDIPACYTEAKDMELSVNGEKVPIIEYNRLYNHANFSFDGEVEIKITVPDEIREFTISPLALELEGNTDENTLTFTLTESKYLLVKIDGYKELAIAADELETDVPDSEGEGIYNIATEYNGLGSSPEKPNDALQRAIDDAHRAGGGIVYVPNGVYYTGNVVLKSNVSLYLEPSAVIRATGNWDDYQNHFRKNGLKMDGTWFITNEPGAENIRIYGRGYLDGNGHLMRENGHLNHLLLTMQLSGLEIDGITIKDAGFWMVVITRSDDINIQNVKFYNDNDTDSENDAIDICESQEVMVKHTIAVSVDDTYSTKTWNKKTDIAGNWVGEPEELNEVTFDDCFGWSRCCTFKVGAGCSQPQKNITFKNSYSYQSMVALKITPAYADASEYSYVENVVFDNIDIEGFWPQKEEWHMSMWLQLEAQHSSIPIYNTVVKDIRVRSLDPRMQKSRLYGRPNAMFEGIVMENIYLPGNEKPARTLEEMGVNGNGYYEGLIILPSEIQMDEKNIILHDDFSTKLEMTKENKNVAFDKFSGFNGGGIIRSSKDDEAYVVYDARNAKGQIAEGIELRVNSYEENKFPVEVYSSSDEYGDGMVWQPVSIQDKEHGDYADTEIIKFWKWDVYEGRLPDDIRYVKVVLPNPDAPKLWHLMLDDVLLYSDSGIQPSIELRPSQENIRIKAGKTVTLYPIIRNAADPEVKFDSSSPTVATVDSKGEITALEQGETVVTAELAGTGIKTSAKVQVYKEITDISVSETAIVLDKGDSYQLEALVTPEDSEEKVTWFSTNDRIVTVDEKGEVTALRYGQAVIMCETESHMRVSCIVKVVRSGVKSILYDPLSDPAFPENMLAYEATGNLNYDVYGNVTDGGIKRTDNAEDAYIIYKVTDPKYMQYKLNYYFQTSKVQDKLHIYASKDGEEWSSVEMEEVDRTERIRADWNQVSYTNKEVFEAGAQYIKLAIPQIQDLGGNGNRFWALIIEEVEIFGESDEIEKITVKGPEKIKAGEEALYKAVIEPAQAAGKEVVWSVTDRSGKATQLAEIDSATGMLKALETGEIRVTAATADESGITGSLEVEITEDSILVDTIVIEGKTVLGFHETAEYAAIIFPGNADNQNVEWLLEEKSHEDIAAINEDGVVETGDVEGSFVIIASASDASRAVGKLKVRVQEEAEEKILIEEITIQGPDQVTQGDKVRYKAVATPANATKKDVVWTVENLDGRADISANGMLTAKTPGEVRIIAAAIDGSGVTEELIVDIVKKQSGSDNESGGSSGGGSRSSRPVKRVYMSSMGNAADWRKDDRGWWLAVGEGYARDEWKLIDGKWYFFDKDGYMVTGWKCFDRSKWYYMLPDGAMAVGWVQIKNEWYYFYSSGEMAADGLTPDGYSVDKNGRWYEKDIEPQK